ncbi:MAG: hypothetical protein ACOC23_09530 [Thermodesulfobacteriota bacterium]
MEIQTTIEKLPEIIRKLNLPSQTAIRVIIDDREIAKHSPPPEKNRWAMIAERISENSPLDKKAGEVLRAASRDFRNNFRFREPPSFHGKDQDD